jgi:hypothetical protein
MLIVYTLILKKFQFVNIGENCFFILTSSLNPTGLFFVGELYLSAGNSKIRDSQARFRSLL